MTFKNIIDTIGRKEWLFVAILSSILIIITATPYLYGYLNAPPDFYFTGRSSINSADTLNYYAYLEQAKQGHFLFKNLMTGEEQNRLLFNPFLLAVGLLAKFFNLSSPLAWQLARLLLIPAAAITLYIFLSFLFEEKIKRKIGIVLLLFSSGLGALFAPLLVNAGLADPSVFWYYWPPDLWMPESNTFMTLYHNPLHIVALIFIVLIFLFAFLSLENDKTKYSVTAGILSLILFLLHPYHVLTIYGVLGVYLLVIFIKNHRIAWISVKHYLILFFISFPSPLYYYILLKYDPAKVATLKQWQSFTPAPWAVIIGFGLPILLSLFEILNTKKSTIDKKNIFIITWFAVGFFLIYCWFIGWPRRLIQGLQIPVIILSVNGLFIFYKYLKEKKILQKVSRFKFYLLPTAALLLFFSNVILIKNDLALYNDKNSYAYISKSAKEAVEWIKHDTPENSVILASSFAGNFIAGFSGRAVFIGHKDETINFDQKSIEINWFFRNNNQKNNGSFLKFNKIDYLFYGDEEKKISNFNPETVNYLKKSYQNNEITIYKVIEN